MDEKYVFVFEKYMFYSGNTILMISEDYNLVKQYFDTIKKETGYGYHIHKYKCDEKIGRHGYESVVWIEIDYDGKIKDFCKGVDDE